VCELFQWYVCCKRSGEPSHIVGDPMRFMTFSMAQCSYTRLSLWACASTLSSIGRCANTAADGAPVGSDRVGRCTMSTYCWPKSQVHFLDRGPPMIPNGFSGGAPAQLAAKDGRTQERRSMEEEMVEPAMDEPAKTVHTEFSTIVDSESSACVCH